MYIFGLILIKLYKKPTFFLKKLLYIYKATIKILLLIIILVFLLYITKLIKLYQNANR